jgi:AcrR family transcriptional regulator
VAHFGWMQTRLAVSEDQARKAGAVVSGVRPGGRSARVQAAVHAATEALLATMPRAAVTVPAIAAKAGVTPSTIYRRWGDLQELFADVAVQRIRPDAGPVDTGSAVSDLTVWIEQYSDEMASDLGRDLIRDVLASRAEGRAAQCCGMVREQIAIIAARASDRGEAFPDPEAVIDHLVAPVVYRILFDTPPEASFCRGLVGRLLAHDR